MMSGEQVFSMASDEALIGLIDKAEKRLVVIAPALTRPVADALAKRLNDLDRVNITVILDSDPEVYRLGFGDVEALAVIRQASNQNLFDLREQPGIRIAVVISDADTMIYAPVSKNIEAGSTTENKPNALFLPGAAANAIAAVAGADTKEKSQKAEIGADALAPEKVGKMQEDLKQNPPEPFDIARKMRVFSSQMKYVEFSVSNYQLTTRKVQLPESLSDLADKDLRKSIYSHIKSPFDGIGKVVITIGPKETGEKIEIDEKWIREERKKIEDNYTFLVPNFGRLILLKDLQAFNSKIENLEKILNKYQSALTSMIKAKENEFVRKIVLEFAPRWQQKQPEYFSRWNIKPTDHDIESELKKLAAKLFEKGTEIEAAKIKVIYKNVAPENVSNKDFIGPLKKILTDKGAPETFITSLFTTDHAAPKAGAFL